MNKYYSILLSFLVALPVYANNTLEPLLNKISLQLHAEQWITTKTALVTVGVNASVTGKGIEKIQNEVMQKLNQLSKGADWHIVSFERQLDQSGLESIRITAQARLPQSDLSNLRDKAKTISQPGETYTIDDIQFIPSDDEITQANTMLRNNIYQQAKAEIEAINKLYPDQKYYLHQIDFAGLSTVNPMPMVQASYMKGAPQPSPRMPLSVGNKAEITASVVLAATPDVMQKVVQNKI